jgi:uncharacterized protein YkwD
MKTGKKNKGAVRLIACLLVFGIVLSGTFTVQAAAQPRINKVKKTLLVGNTFQLKVSGTSQKITWKSSNTKVATVSKNGLVKAKKKGTATITAKIGEKKYQCRITVVTLQKSYESTTIRLINKERRKYGYASFDTNPLLQSAAQKRAKELYQQFSDTRPNGSKFTSAISMKYDFKYAAENIACDFATPSDVVEAWMDGASSKAKIISKRYTEIGVGVYLGEDGYLYWAAIFASPK